MFRKFGGLRGEDFGIDIAQGDEADAVSTFVTARAFDGTPGVNFNRTGWPHGNFSNAKPHSQLFVTADGDVK